MIVPGKVENSLAALNPRGLYERTQIVDPEHGEIVILTPITEGRIRDADRETRFFSSITIQYRGMPQNLGFEIKAGSLSEAVEKWLETANEMARGAIEQLEKKAFQSALTMPSSARMPPVKPN